MSAEAVITRARARGVTITAGESCTGGRLMAALTDVPGASAVIDRGVVTYSNAAKEEMLGVRPATLAAHGAVSEPVAGEMAEGALARSGSDLGAAITGIAGPGGSEHKPEGRVCFALAERGGPTRTETVEFGALGRAGVRAASVDHALAMLAAALEA